MNELISLKEVEPPLIFHSQLNTPNRSSRYCVLAENSFIIFKNSSDVMSLYRIPVNKSTILEFYENEFIISYGDFKLNFLHSDSALILQWKNFLSEVLNNDIKEVLSKFYAEVVQIDKMKKSSECPIVISKVGWKLHIYESYKHQRSGICTHIIHLGYYTITRQEIKETILRTSSMILIIKGFLIEFKLTFNTPKIALEWFDILKCSKDNYFKSLMENSVLTEIYKNKSNKFCSDCGVPDPQWVSINICITLCENCVGIHRRFGAMISRTQSIIMDNKCFNDSLLVDLLNVIGNENANNFWCKNSPAEFFLPTMVNIERKYVNKEFIDQTHLNLSVEDIIEKLSVSVRSSDLMQTMCLWFSNKTTFEREVLDNLLNYARTSGQILQEKFLSLQGNVSQLLSTDSIYTTSIFEGIFNLRYDNSDKVINFSLVSLFGNRIVIKVDDPDLLQKTTVDVCTIYLNYLNMVQFNSSKNILQLAFYPQCKFLKVTTDKLRSFGYVNISRLSLFDTSSKTLLTNLKLLLLEYFTPQFFEPPSKKTSLFLLVDIQINKELIVQCWCHVTNHELVLGSPVNTKYDLTTAQNITEDTDKSAVLIILPHCDLRLVSRDCGREILCCVREASQIRLLSLNKDQTVIRLEELINFIKFFGLNSEKIFEKCGDSTKIEKLFIQVVEAEIGFSVNSRDYSVDDVAICLKKCLLSLNEPLITDEVMWKFKSDLVGDDLIESFIDDIKLLPPNNYRILRHFIELLFLIEKRAKYNKMDSENLSQSVSLFDNSNDDQLNVGNKILKYFIENFENLFNYSDKEKEVVVKFLSNLDNPSKTTITRPFYIDLSLKYFFCEKKFILVEHKKLDSVIDNSVFLSVTMRIDECRTINDITTHMFDNLSPDKVNLWLFIYVKNKACKRLFYGNEITDDVIVHRRPLSGVFSTDKAIEVLLFIPVEKPSNTIGTLYRCPVKMDGRQCEVIVSLPISLKIYDLESESEEPICDLKLSDVNFYRSHGCNPGKMYILTADNKTVTCEFKKQIEFQEFFLHVDMFYLRNIPFNAN